MNQRSCDFNSNALTARPLPLTFFTNCRTCQIAFFTDCRTCIILMIKKLSKRSPLKSLIWNFRIFDHNMMISYNNTKNKSCSKHLLHHLINLKHLSRVFCNSVKKKCSSFLSESSKIGKDKFILIEVLNVWMTFILKLPLAWKMTLSICCKKFDPVSTYIDGISSAIGIPAYSIKCHIFTFNKISYLQKLCQQI